MNVLFKLVRIGFGVVFVAASIDKIIHPDAFAHAVHNYQLLPDVTINSVAIVLPWLELILGFLLMAGVWIPGGVLLSSGLMTIFFVVLVYNQVRGLDVACGCFSTAPAEKGSGVLYIARDGLFLAMGIYLFVKVFMDKQYGKGVSRA